MLAKVPKEIEGWPLQTSMFELLAREIVRARLLLA